MKVYIVTLYYYGETGEQIVKVYQDEKDAIHFCEERNRILETSSMSGQRYTYIEMDVVPSNIIE